MARFIILALIILFIPINAFCDIRVAVFMSAQNEQYHEALSGFKSYLEDKKYIVTYKSFDMNLNQDNLKEKVSKNLEDFDPTLILAIGTTAASFANQCKGLYPVIYSMVLNPQRAGLTNLKGVTLKIPPAKTISKVVNIFPENRKIAFLYDMNQKDINIQSLAKEVSKKNIKLIPYGVTSKRDLKNSIIEASKNADFIFTNSDPLLYNKDSAQSIILWTIIHKIPLIAFSSNYVKAGAFVSVDCDYYDIGRQSGQLASQIAEGEKVKNLKVLSPRKVRVFLNSTTAKSIRFYISKSVVSKFHMVYGE